MLQRYRAATALQVEVRARTLRRLEQRLQAGEEPRVHFDVPAPELPRGFSLGARMWIAAAIAALGLGGGATLWRATPAEPAPAKHEADSRFLLPALPAPPPSAASSNARLEPERASATPAAAKFAQTAGSEPPPTAAAGAAPRTRRTRRLALAPAVVVAPPPLGVPNADLTSAESAPGAAPHPANPDTVGSIPQRGEARASVDTLADEIQLLEAARAAQKRGDSRRALSLLAEHRWQFPSGQLAEAREVARILTLCAADRMPQARALGQRFLQLHGRSPFAARVRASCAGGP
jgi:hypothetical protein